MAPETHGLAFSIIGDPPRIAWERDPVTLNADDALVVENQARRKTPGPEREALSEATTWLAAALADGPRPARDLVDEWCNGHGGSKRTLDRAKQTLSVEAHRSEVPGPWWWRLPGKDAKPTEAEQLGNLGNLAENTANLTLFDGGEVKDAKMSELGILGAASLPEPPVQTESG